MIWSEFQESVRTLLTVDAQRKGAGIQNYIDSIILSGVIELQQYIPSLRSMNRDTFYSDQLKPSKHIEMQGIQQGFTNGRSKITKAVVLKPQGESVVAIELNRWPWENRNSLAMECLSDCRSARFPGKIMDCKRHNNSFYLYPSLSEDELLVLDWEGVKTNFTDNDETPYDHRVVKVVSDYAKAHIVREVDKDLQLYKEYYGMYIKERSVLFLDEKDSTLFDLPSISEDYYSTCCIKSDSLSRLVSPPEAPEFVEVFTTPYFKPSGLTYVFVTSAPTGLSIPNARKTLYHSNAISNSDIQIPQIPTNLQFFQSNADGTELAPTNLQYYVGVATPPSDLSAEYKPASPRNLRTYVATAPASPTFLRALPGVVSAPTDLSAYPAAPSRLTGHQTVANNTPTAPTELSVLPVSPTELDFTLTNASGTIDFPFAPDQLEAVHDGCAESEPASYDIGDQELSGNVLMIAADGSYGGSILTDQSTWENSVEIPVAEYSFEQSADTFPDAFLDVAGLVDDFKTATGVNYGSLHENYFKSWGSSVRAYPRKSYPFRDSLDPEDYYQITPDADIWIVPDPRVIKMTNYITTTGEGVGIPKTSMAFDFTSEGEGTLGYIATTLEAIGVNDSNLQDFRIWDAVNDGFYAGGEASLPSDFAIDYALQSSQNYANEYIGGQLEFFPVDFNGGQYVPYAFVRRAKPGTEQEFLYRGIIILVPLEYAPSMLIISRQSDGLAAGSYVQGVDFSQAVPVEGGCIQGGGWIPESPSSLVAEVEEQAPPAPTGLEESNLYLVWRYEFDGTNFVRKEFTLMDINAEDGGTGTIEEY